MSTIADVIERVQDRIRVDSLTGCHEWQGWIGANGYGYLWLDGRGQLAHRVAYALFVGDLADNMVIDHLCMNTICVNPEHLEQVTQVENVKRWAEARFKTCKRGHDEWAVNSHNGRRYCKPCHNEGQRKRRYEKGRAR